METLAYIETAIAHEDPNPEPQLRSLKELGLTLPSSAWVGLAGIMLAASMLVTQVPMAQAATYVTVSSGVSALNVRYGPGTGYGLFGRPLYAGETVRVVNSSNGWYQLPDGGWFSSAYTTSGGPSGPGGGGGTPINQLVTVTASAVNVRYGPSTGYGLFGRPLYRGETVRVVNSSNGWYQLTDGGWFSASYATGGGGSGGGSPSTAVVSTNGSPLLIRSSPGGSIIGSLANGTTIRLSGAVSGGFSQLSSGGWVSSSWIY